MLVAAAAAKIMQTCQAPPFVEFWCEAVVGARGRLRVLVQAGMRGEDGNGPFDGVEGGGLEAVGKS